MIAPRMIGLVKSPFGYALWNKEGFDETEVSEKYIRVSDCLYLLSIIDTLIEAGGEELDPDDKTLIEQIRADLADSD